MIGKQCVKVALWVAVVVAQPALASDATGQTELPAWRMACVSTDAIARVPNERASPYIEPAQADFAADPFNGLIPELEFLRVFAYREGGDLLLEFNNPQIRDIGFMYRFDREGRLVDRLAYSYWGGMPRSCEQLPAPATPSAQ